ncbi:REP-associated tyrosine transposase [Nitrosomonas sp.]|uniref:REP-associated tyrosine transposase n=1 Tax=Nitrosomonas sp. TaxID=42353 RepID=UPI002842D496|nr:transposase [Nitrosomonas sp.]MCP5241810.1 transposase [Burkholderiales bacterium]MDR4513126.1 transposase [Nitrosomonas sp.]
MTAYRRIHVPGASWFFTVNLAVRKNNRLLVDKIDLLREAFDTVRQRRAFRIDAVVILPDHLHCIWTLPPSDADFSTRWNMIKGYFSRHIETGEPISDSRQSRRERGIWQRRFWEHLLRDQNDFNRHMDYIHWNPVKHGWVEKVRDWPYSSFHRYVKQGVYPEDWGNVIHGEIDGVE